MSNLSALLSLFAVLIWGEMLRAGPCCQKGAIETQATNAFSTNSIYELGAIWQDDNGRDFHLSELAGEPVVISMFFATCEGVCLITKDDMKTVEASLPAKIRQHTKFVLVTLDPNRDTAASLKDYRVEQNLSRKRWYLLRGSTGDTARLATLLGIGYGKDQTGLFRHSSAVIILDKTGKIISWQDGVHADLSVTAARLRSLR